ncbi:RDD family protein [Verrucomicrobium spinosum]|uniref:RDD family protein n=1 Tax=Verrucomicrobium spinosum TaxID=2736 RepID=UPI0001744640|nr:RDD family protein [Verrucomicrobium spinosum]
MTEIIKPTELETASVAQRVVAHLIDLAVMFGAMMLPVMLNPGGNVEVLMLFCSMFAVLGYRLFGDAVFGGAALGKRLLGLRVVDAETRHPCSYMQCAIRTGITLIPLAPVVEFILLAIDGQQRWGDQLARTYVLRRHAKAEPYHAPSHPIDFAGLKETVSHLHPHGHAEDEVKR